MCIALVLVGVVSMIALVVLIGVNLCVVLGGSTTDLKSKLSGVPTFGGEGVIVSLLNFLSGSSSIWLLTCAFFPSGLNFVSIFPAVTLTDFSLLAMFILFPRVSNTLSSVNPFMGSNFGIFFPGFSPKLISGKIVFPDTLAS